MSFFIAYHPVYVYAVPVGHRFPMEKYRLLYEQLAYEGILEDATVLVPELIDLEIVKLAHEAAYLEKLLTLQCTDKEQRVSGFQHNHALVERELRIMEGTRLCAEAVRNGGVALNIAGGTHHAFSNRGEGFCLLNDQAIAAKWLLDNGYAKRILIVDLDVHQGNGTAAICQNDERIFTFSMHGSDNYPLKKEISTLDIPLPSKINDADYLSLLETHLSQIFSDFSPDFVFYQCGVDILATDKLGLLAVSHTGIQQRDAFVFACVQQTNVPLVCTMGGGYSEHIRDIVNAHMHVFRLANQVVVKNL